MTSSISRILSWPAPCRFAQELTNPSSEYRLSSLAGACISSGICIIQI